MQSFLPPQFPASQPVPPNMMPDILSNAGWRLKRACRAPPPSPPGLLDATSWAEQEESKSGQRWVRPAGSFGRGPFLLTNASTSGSRCGEVSGSLEKERKGVVPQLTLFPGNLSPSPHFRDQRTRAAALPFPCGPEWYFPDPWAGPPGSHSLPFFISH